MEDNKKLLFRIFPGNYPYVTNKDGTRSNVKTATVSFGEGDKEMHYVIPTLVDGKQRTIKEAIEIAKGMGLDRYPKFKTGQEADTYSKKIHGNINEQGFLLK